MTSSWRKIEKKRHFLFCWRMYASLFFLITTHRMGKISFKNYYLQVFILGLWPGETKPKLKYTYLKKSRLVVPQVTYQNKPNFVWKITNPGFKEFPQIKITSLKNENKTHEEAKSKCVKIKQQNKIKANS